MPASIGPGCVHLLAGREILVDAVDAHRTRVVERDQNIFGGDVGARMDRAHRQAYRLAMLFQGAGRGIDREGGDVMLGAGAPVSGRAAAARDIEIAVRGMRPGVLHARRQRHRFALCQRHAVHIHVVMREVGSDIRVKRDLARGRLLRRRQFGRRQTGCGHRDESSAADHRIPPGVAGERLDERSAAPPPDFAATCIAIAPRRGYHSRALRTPSPVGIPIAAAPATLFARRRMSAWRRDFNHGVRDHGDRKPKSDPSGLLHATTVIATCSRQCVFRTR